MFNMRYICLILCIIFLSTISFSSDSCLVRLNNDKHLHHIDYMYGDWIYYIVDEPPDSGIGYPPQDVEGKFISVGEVLDPEDFGFQYGRAAISRVSCWYQTCTGEVMVHISNTDYWKVPYDIDSPNYNEYWSGGPYRPTEDKWYDINLGSKVVITGAVIVHFQYKTSNKEYYLGFDEDTSGPWYAWAYHSDDGEWFNITEWNYKGDLFVRAFCETVSDIVPSSLGTIKATFK